MPPDLYIFIDTDSKVYAVFVLTPTEVVAVTTDAPTIDAAVISLLTVAPSHTVKGVYVMSYVNFQTCRRNVEALRNAGYTNIETIDVLSLSMSSFIYNLPLNCAVGDVVFVCVCPIEVFAVLQKYENNWEIVMINSPEAILTCYPSVRNVVFNEEASDKDKALIKDQFPGCQLHSNAMIQPDFKDNLNGCEVLPYLRYELLIDFGDKRDTVPMCGLAPPYTISKEINIGNVRNVEIRVDEDGEPLLKAFKFKSEAFRIVEITVNVDRTHVPQVSLKTIATSESKNTSTTVNEPTKLSNLPTSHNDDVDKAASTTTLPNALSRLTVDPSPTTILTFTNDNRVLIEASKTYTGTNEVLAYVRLQDGKAPEVGQKAFDALKKHSDSVYYDITRLLAFDFDPDYPHPSWGFKTTRDADGKLLVHGGDNIVIPPIVLFGIVVKCTLQYIKDHQKCDIPTLGIQLPIGSVISDAELKNMSQPIGVQLVQVSRDYKIDKVRRMAIVRKQLFLLRLHSATAILTFTSDNRVLIKADEIYTGTNEVLAYVRLETGMAPQVGKQVFDALKKHPDSIYYDITRLLAFDFDPAHPNPLWRFKTFRGADGKVLIHGGDNITTFPIVLFGLVVNSTLLYIKEHQKSEVTELRIRLPLGSTVSDEDLKGVAQRIGIKLVLLVD